MTTNKNEMTEYIIVIDNGKPWSEHYNDLLAVQERLQALAKCAEHDDSIIDVFIFKDGIDISESKFGDVVPPVEKWTE